ncbi:hypothetical protein BHE74_00011932 [Ensete ventricosum]|nr:hypothetical protein BHE74_00011932 [Ensete ventricosum]
MIDYTFSRPRRVHDIICIVVPGDPSINVVTGIDLNDTDIIEYLHTELGLLIDATLHINSNCFYDISPKTSLVSNSSTSSTLATTASSAHSWILPFAHRHLAPHLGCHESWVTRVGSKKSPSARPNDDPRRGAAKKKKRRRSPMRAERREGQQKDPIAKEEEIFAGGLEVPFLEHGGAVFIGLRFGLLERIRNGSTALSRTTRTPASDYG